MVQHFRDYISNNRDLQTAIEAFTNLSYDWKRNPKNNDIYYNSIFNFLEKLKHHKDDEYPWDLIKKIIRPTSDYIFNHFKYTFSDYQNKKLVPKYEKSFNKIIPN